MSEPVDPGDIIHVPLTPEGMKEMLEQAFQLWVNPEIERRRAEGQIGEDFNLTAAQRLQWPDGRIAVRLNAEIRGGASTRVTRDVEKGGGFAAEDVGVDLMRRAFNPNGGPLRRAEDPASEREALSALFAGAIGSYKNPHSHRTVLINDPQEAQEMAVLASHLLRIVEARRAR